MQDEVYFMQHSSRSSEFSLLQIADDKAMRQVMCSLWRVRLYKTHLPAHHVLGIYILSSVPAIYFLTTFVNDELPVKIVNLNKDTNKATKASFYTLCHICGDKETTSGKTMFEVQNPLKNKRLKQTGHQA